MAREAEVRANYASTLRPAGWTRPGLDDFMHALLTTSRRLQTTLRVAIQGGRGSWSEESLAAAYPAVRVRRFATVEAAWRAVEAGVADAAWLAAHNTRTGDIDVTRNVRVKARLLAASTYPVQHALLARQGVKLTDLRHVVGHPQALAQCAEALRRLVPRAQTVASVDGAHAARRLQHQEPTAVLASRRVAARLGLRVLHAAMAEEGNATTFHLLVPPEASGTAA